MEEALLARLLATTAIAARIGDRAAWGERIDAEVLPALVLTRVTPGRDYSHDGFVGLHAAMVQIDCMGNSYLEAMLLSREVITAVEPRATQGSVQFGQSFLEAERGMDPTDLPGGERAYRVSLDFTIFFKE